MPKVIDETNANCSDIEAARGIFNLPAGSIVVMDCGYNDYVVTHLKEIALHAPLGQNKIAEDPDKQWEFYKMHFTGTKAQKVCADIPFQVLQ